MSNTNIGQAFPLESLASDIARNSYNYQSILNGLIEWDRSTEDTVTIRLSKDSSPFFQDYVIPSKKAGLSVTNQGVIKSENIAVNGFANSSQINMVLYGGSSVNTPPWEPDQNDLGDSVTFRIKVLNNGNTTWKLYFIPHVEIFDDMTDWDNNVGRELRYGNLVRYSGVLYRLVNNVTIVATQYPNINPAFTLASIGEDDPQPISEFSTFENSSICKYRLKVDVDGFIVKNVGLNPSSSEVDIEINISTKAQELPSLYQKSVDVLSSSNYALWPENKSRVWFNTNPISPTNVALPITRRQPYSASMYFNHADQATSKTVNYVNYDGPDLDQGLCVYLPVEVPVGLGTAIPEDGFTYEFYFRIWPNHTLTNAVTRDHIVNKSHIYVYSSPDMDSIYFDDLDQNEPIAKFSMARMTNFYMFGENVTIPDVPVIYRATFIFSKLKNKWICLDYYQLPDHIFMGPVGFIHPQNPGSLDINNDVIGEINPNAKFIGYETGAFPTFSDIFSNPNLSPYMVNDSNNNEFINRIIS